MLVSKTPLRVSLFGGGSDIPAFFRNNRGAVVGGAINKFIYSSLIFFEEVFLFLIQPLEGVLLLKAEAT